MNSDMTTVFHQVKVFGQTFLTKCSYSTPIWTLISMNIDMQILHKENILSLHDVYFYTLVITQYTWSLFKLQPEIFGFWQFS